MLDLQLIETLAVLFALFGSGWSEWVMVAVLVCLRPFSTIAVMTKVCGVEVLTVPAVHTPVDES